MFGPGAFRRDPQERTGAPSLAIEEAEVSPVPLGDLAGEAARKAGASCSLDTPAITDGDQVGQPSKDETRRRETLRGLMLTLDLHTWLQIAARRAFAALEHLEEGLRGKGYWIPALEGGPPG